MSIEWTLECLILDSRRPQDLGRGLAEPSNLAAALILATCTSGRWVPDELSQSLPGWRDTVGKLNLIGLVGSTGTEGFDFCRAGYYHSRTASPTWGLDPGTVPDFPRRRNECRARASPQGFWRASVDPLAFSAGFCEELAFAAICRSISGHRWQQRLAVLFPSDCIRRWPSLRRSRRGGKNHSFRSPVRAARRLGKSLRPGMIAMPDRTFLRNHFPRRSRARSPEPAHLGPVSLSAAALAAEHASSVLCTDRGLGRRLTPCAIRSSDVLDAPHQACRRSRNLLPGLS